MGEQSYYLFIDRKDDKIYKSIKIGNQVWMAENLSTTVFRNGDPIQEVKNKDEWYRLGNKKNTLWCYYENDSNIGEIYGKLYNWYAINDHRNISPNGWHVPSKDEWKEMINFLNVRLFAGSKLKEEGLLHWESPNKRTSNISGFTALPAGFRSNLGTFSSINKIGSWWSKTEHIRGFAWGLYLNYKDNYESDQNFDKNCGFSIRCIKDNNSVKDLMIESEIKIINVQGQDTLKNRFPSLQDFIKQGSSIINEINISKDTENTFEFRFPIFTFGKVTGYNQYGVKKMDNLYYGLFCYMTSIDKLQRIDATIKLIENDLAIEEYAEIYIDMVNEIAIKSMYMNL